MRHYCNGGQLVGMRNTMRSGEIILNWSV